MVRPSCVRKNITPQRDVHLFPELEIAKIMISIANILALMRHGFHHDDIRFGMPISQIIAKLGRPDNIMGNNQLGYITYDFLRIGYWDDIVDEIAIFFEGDSSLKLRIDEETSDDEGNVIKTGMMLHDFISLLNNHGIFWQGQYRQNELDYVSLRVENMSDVTFHLDTGSIYRIAFSPHASPERISPANER
jgi:hypothetical protein